MADKLQKDAVRGAIDGANKLFKANQYTLVAGTGYSAQYRIYVGADGKLNVDHDNPVFDSITEAKEFYRQLDYSGSVYPDCIGMCEAVRAAFIRAFGDKPESDWPGEHAENNYALFNVIVFHYNQADKRLELFPAKFHYKKESPLTLSWDNIFGLKPEMFETSKAWCYGEVRIVDEILAGRQFGEWDKDGLLSAVSVKPIRSDRMSLLDAERGAARLIALTSINLPGDTDNPVGLVVDVAFIRPDSGIEWLKQGVNVSSLDKVCQSNLRK